MSLVHRVLNLFYRSKVGRKIEAELKSHIEIRIHNNRRYVSRCSSCQPRCLNQSSGGLAIRVKHRPSVWTDAISAKALTELG